MRIKLKRSMIPSIIGGHLLQHIDPEKIYEMTPEKHFKGEIQDDSGEPILLSNTCFKRYFFTVR